MLTAIIVEDQRSKSRKVVELLRDTALFDSHGIDVAEAVFDARRALAGKQYDIMILDVVLPPRRNEIPQAGGGIEILRDVMTRDEYKRPRYIVGLTAYPDAFQAAAAEFADYTWAVVQYEEDSTGWHGPIERLAYHVAKSATIVEGASGHAYGIDVGVISALPDELEPMLANGWKWSSATVPGDSAEYFQATVPVADYAIRVVAATAARMGMVASAILAANVIHQFKPRVIVMIGICAGVKGEIQLGDIAIADPSWDYQSGKREAGKMEIAPYQLPLKPAVRRRFMALAQDRDLLAAIKRSWVADAPTSELAVHIGPFASGSAVLADQAQIDELKGQHRKLIAIDMEVYGVYAAASEACLPSPAAVALKGVSDLGDEEKDDKVRKYAAYVSSALLTKFVEREYPGLVAFL